MIIRYCIFDPTGNITALVESEVEEAKQPAVASRIMDRHPDVEQVGFVRFRDDAESGADVDLRMAGGEFCGNATMSSAVLYAIRKGEKPESVLVKASGVEAPIEVRLKQKESGGFETAVCMPPALGIDERNEEIKADWITAAESIPVVHMEGIDHIIIDQDSAFYALLSLQGQAETAVKKLQSDIGSDCLGMMFLAGPSEEEGSGDCTGTCVTRSLIPLVYVPGADTIFWENSCASGSTAAGMYLAAKAGRAVDVIFDEPAGKLRVKSDPESGETWLFGSSKLTGEDVIEIDIDSL